MRPNESGTTRVSMSRTIASLNDLRIFVTRSSADSITFDTIRKRSKPCFIPFFKMDVELFMRTYIAGGPVKPRTEVVVRPDQPKVIVVRHLPESREAYGIEAVALGNVIACGLQRPQLAYRWCHPQSARIERTGARRVTRSVGCTRHHGVTHRVSRGILETEDALL